MRHCADCGGMIPEQNDPDIGICEGEPCECRGHNNGYIVVDTNTIKGLPKGFPLFGKALRMAMFTTH